MKRLSSAMLLALHLHMLLLFLVIDDWAAAFTNIFYKSSFGAARLLNQKDLRNDLKLEAMQFPVFKREGPRSDNSDPIAARERMRQARRDYEAKLLREEMELSNNAMIVDVEEDVVTVVEVDENPEMNERDIIMAETASIALQQTEIPKIAYDVETIEDRNDNTIKVEEEEDTVSESVTEAEVKSEISGSAESTIGNTNIISLLTIDDDDVGSEKTSDTMAKSTTTDTTECYTEIIDMVEDMMNETENTALNKAELEKEKKYVEVRRIMMIARFENETKIRCISAHNDNFAEAERIAISEMAVEENFDNLQATQSPAENNLLGKLW